ncbi:nuclear transport factor 2 family protein [Algisphaera agarilytica]|uniref:Ketosteroid isomerase-like protein n=1 Tax=Algisphaera agarilytica TaxID=1385975 RepID=A0A7X0HB10_9BACT|nr:nuclear transport factor 2 family protein [Algisphaera agarilytica]MBB6431421.1 ketosteroid isomerase-like protein [Algisphaera agarilytica]
MSESLLDKTKTILEQLKNGQFVEGMEEFYADNVVNEEPTGATIEGKAALIAHEHEVLANVAAYHGCEVRSVGVGEDDGQGNGVTFAEYKLSVDMKDGSKFNPDQVQVIRWENGKAIHNKFYYNPDF